MAYPTVHDADTVSGAEGVASFAHTLSFPTNLAAGQLVFLALNTNVTADNFTMPAGFVLIPPGSDQTRSATTMAIYGYEADGTEGPTFAVTSLLSSRLAYIAYRVSGWDAAYVGTNPDGQVSQGSGGNPSISTPVTCDWGAADNLFFAAISLANANAISGYPYANGQVTVATNRRLACCWMTSPNAQAPQPGPWVLALNNWIRWSAGVKPGTAGLGSSARSMVVVAG